MSKLSKEWLISTVLSLLLFFSEIAGFSIKEDIDYAKYNDYAMDHLAERVFSSLQSSAMIAIVLTITAGQIVFFLVHLINKNSAKKMNNKAFAVISSVVSIIIVNIVSVLTLPLWFNFKF